MPEAIDLKLGCHCCIVQRGVVAILCLSWRDVSDGRKETPVVEPVNPLERGVFDGFKGSPWTSAMDDFGLVKTIDRLGQSIVIAIADAADRGFDTGLRKTLCVLD